MMAGTIDIKDFTKYPSLSDNDNLLGTKTELGGTGAGITVGNFRKQVAADAAPVIKNGYWWINGVNTGVVAQGQTPVFRYTSWGLEYKLQGQDDAAFQKLIPLADIKFDWEDLTPEQKAELKGEQGLSAYQVWLSVSGNAGKTMDEYLAWLRQPATDAAERADDKLAQISQEVSQAIGSANTATGNANTAAASAQDTSDHPTYISENFYVYKWNKATKAYDKTDIFTKGDGFSIDKVYPSITAMNADKANIREGRFVLINTNDVENPDNAKLYIRTTVGFDFLVDMSGAIGFTGKTPQFRVGNVTSGVEGSQASMSLSEGGTDVNGNPVYSINLSVPRGDKGKVPVISMGTVTTIAPGGAASAQLVPNGTAEAGEPKYTLNMSIPKGDTGGLGSGDALNLTVSFTEATTRANIGSGEKMSVLFGKIKKFFSDLKTVAFTGKFSDLIDIPTTVDGYGITDASKTGHKHAKSEITDFPTSMPASDVSAWAKAANKPIYTASEVGALPISGGTVNGNITATTFNGALNGVASIATYVGSATKGSKSQGIYLNLGTPTVMSDTVGSSTTPVYMNAGVITECSSSLETDITGNSSTATKLQTARTIWGQSFDGTGNVTGTFTNTNQIVSSGAGAGFYRTSINGSSWNMGEGAYNISIFNNSSQTPLLLAYRAGTTDNAGANRLFAMELLNDGTTLRFGFGGSGNYVFSSDGTLTCKLNGNANTATRLQTASTINGVPFDGTANITLPNATTTLNGLMSATDKNRMDNAVVPNIITTVTTLASLSIANYSIKATLSAASTLSFSTTPSEGWECMIDILNSSSTDITQPLPNASNWQCDDTSIVLPAGKVTAISVRYIHGKYVVRT